METVTVFRMETLQGEGPFQSMEVEDFFGFVMLHDITNADRFPAPYQDDGLMDDPNFDHVEGRGVFGCCTVDALKEWFPPQTLPLLEEHDVHLTVWRVPTEHVARSERQAAFLRDQAELVERHPADALYAPLDFKEAA